MMRPLIVALVVVLGGCASANKQFAEQWAANNSVKVIQPDGTIIEARGAEASALLGQMEQQLRIEPPAVPGPNVGSEGYAAYANSIDKYYLAAALNTLARALDDDDYDPQGIAIAAINADSRTNQAWISGGLGLGGDVLQAGTQVLLARESQRTTRAAFKALADGGNTSISVGSISQSVNGVTATAGEGGTVGEIAGGDRGITIGRDVRNFNVSDNGMLFSETGDGDVFGLQQSEAVRPINNFPKAVKNGNTPCDSCFDNNGPQGPISSSGDDSDVKVETPFQPDNDQVGLF